MTPARVDPPWSVAWPSVVDDLDTDVATGLSSGEARRRLARVGPNRLDPEPPVPVWRRLVGQLADPLVVLLLVAVAISLATWAADGATGAPLEAIVVALILVINAVLGVLQEVRADRAVQALQEMAAVVATVVRDGVEAPVAADLVVPGDVLVLGEGDAVVADARLVEAASLAVAEAALTGESAPVAKDVGVLESAVALADRTDMVFAGTAVVRGRGRAVVTATGMATEVGRIAHLLDATEPEPSPLQREIARVGRMLAVAVLGIAVVVVATLLVTADVRSVDDVVEPLLVGLSLAVAAVPEGLPAVLSVVLAVGVRRMARRDALVRNLAAVETLGSASVVAADKTGTLTRNEMTVRRVVTRSADVDVGGAGYAPVGDLRVGGRAVGDGPAGHELERAVVVGDLANDASIRMVDGAWVAQGDPTEAAFVALAAKAGLDVAPRERFRRVGEAPFTSERRMMSTVQVDRVDHLHLLATKGAVDAVLDRCTHELVDRSARPLDDDRRAAIRATMDALADTAHRTLGLAFRRLDGDEALADPHGLEHDLVFVGVAGLLDPPRDEARHAIEEARRAGIRVVMITGDHPRTALRIATSLGLVAPGEQAVLTGRELDALDGDALVEAVRSTSVCARVAPEHKLRLVEALRADGSVVAMTGDGVNDAPALRRADIGVAMGSGTDVAKQAARMVLLDDDFATIVTAVRLGRGIFADIRTFLRYLLSSNVGEVLTMLVGVVAAGLIGLDVGGGAVAAPLLATQILWVNLVTDGLPALALGLDPPPDDVMRRPPRRPTDRIIDPAMWIGVGVVGAAMAVAALLVLDSALPGGLVDGSRDLATARTLAFTTLVVAQLFNTFNARSDHTSAFHHPFTNPWLWAAIASSFLLQVAVVHVPVLNRGFGTVPLTPTDWLWCIAAGSLVVWVDEVRKLVVRRRARGRTG